MSKTSIKAPAPSERTRVRRIAENADYKQASLYAIIDAAYVCHIAFHDEHGNHCIPTACWRIDGHLYIHGSNGSRLLKQLKAGQQTCVTITHLDGLVLAKSAFSHSMNYRSAMIYGVFELVETPSEKRLAMEQLMEHIVEGRQADVRPGNDKEYAATSVLRIALNEAVSKVRSGPPNDDAEDQNLAVWAGVLPLQIIRGVAIPASENSVATPIYVRNWPEPQVL